MDPGQRVFHARPGDRQCRDGRLHRATDAVVGPHQAPHPGGERDPRSATTPSAPKAARAAPAPRWPPRPSAIALAQAALRLDDIGCWPAALRAATRMMPGFASMVQGEWHAPPMQTLLGAWHLRCRHVARWRAPRPRSNSAAQRHALVVASGNAVAPVQALALRRARLRRGFRCALPALDAVRWRRRAGC